MAKIPAVRRLKQEDLKLEASLSYKVRCLFKEYCSNAVSREETEWSQERKMF